MEMPEEACLFGFSIITFCAFMGDRGLPGWVALLLLVLASF